MPAPDIDTLFDLESQVGPFIQAMLETSITEPVKSQGDTSELPSRMVESQVVTTGSADNGTMHHDGVSYHRVWTMAALVRVRTARAADGAAAAHRQMVGKLRVIMQQLPRLVTDLNLPYLYISWVPEQAGGNRTISDDEREEDVTEQTWNFTVEVRQDALPIT